MFAGISATPHAWGAQMVGVMAVSTLGKQCGLSKSCQISPLDAFKDLDMTSQNDSVVLFTAKVSKSAKAMVRPAHAEFCVEFLVIGNEAFSPMVLLLTMTWFDEVFGAS